MIKESLLETKEIRKLYHFINKKKLSFWKFISLGCEEGIMAQDLFDYFPDKCSAGFLSITVLPNGDVFPCRRLPMLCGNLVKQSFEEIYYQSNTLKYLRSKKCDSIECMSCLYYNRCGGGAKCIAYGIFKETTKPDPNCWNKELSLYSKY